MFEDLGNCVRINDRIIPAANIQVDNVPGYLDHGDGTSAWYGIYFEILFETGSLWVVEQGFDKDNLDEFLITEYRNFLKDGITKPYMKKHINNWETFFCIYDDVRKTYY